MSTFWSLWLREKRENGGRDANKTKRSKLKKRNKMEDSREKNMSSCGKIQKCTGGGGEKVRKVT